MEKEDNYHKKKGATRLAAIRVNNIDDSLEVNTNFLIISYSGSEIIPLTERLQSYWCLSDHHALLISICKNHSINKNPIRPEGTYAVITKHGELHEIRKTGGIYYCLPWVIKFYDIIILIDLNLISCYSVTYYIWIECEIMPYFR